MVPASLNVVSAYQLDNLKVCVLDEGDEQANLQEFASSIRPPTPRCSTKTARTLAVAYQKGLCDAVSASASWLNASARPADPASQVILPERISKSVFGPGGPPGRRPVVQDRASGPRSPAWEKIP